MEVGVAGKAVKTAEVNEQLHQDVAGLINKMIRDHRSSKNHRQNYEVRKGSTHLPNHTGLA